jgi:hypothetical protein
MFKELDEAKKAPLGLCLTPTSMVPLKEGFHEQVAVETNNLFTQPGIAFPFAVKVTLPF